MKVVRLAYIITSGGCSQADPTPECAGNMRQFEVGDKIYLTDESAAALGIGLRLLENETPIEVDAACADVAAEAVPALEALAAAGVVAPPPAPSVFDDEE